MLQKDKKHVQVKLTILWSLRELSILEIIINYWYPSQRSVTEAHAGVEGLNLINGNGPKCNNLLSCQLQ